MNPTRIGTHTPFSHPQTLPLRSVVEIAVEPILVVAPHPDDETLGCAGAIALLRSMGHTVYILVMSDGTQSHPHSRKYPKAALQQLREAETCRAMEILGVEEPCITFFALPDGAIATALAPGSAAIDQCQTYLANITPQLILLPWRHDPHPDHRATWQILQTALARLDLCPRLLEYPIWDWDIHQRQLLAEPAVQPWRLDIAEVFALKQQAISAYLSQTTDLINDDPTGFRLTPEMLGNFTQPWELYLEQLEQNHEPRIFTC